MTNFNSYQEVHDKMDEDMLERFAIQTIDSHLTDQEAIELLNKSKGCV